MKTAFVDNAPEDLKVIDRKDSMYHYARVISNTRFGKMPAYIAYCKNATHVQYCIDFCRTYNFPFRIRSGGHQHEGMCSANDVIIIDLSEMHEISYLNPDKTVAWIPAGKQLGQVYQELQRYGKTIPGGGCQSVNVGGLTQGGGWGTSVRKFGLTCDSVTAIEIVLADGSIVTATKKEHSDLFWALRGGGGGNFGVVLRFKFDLVSILPVTTTFTLRWEHPEEIQEVITKWAELHAKTDGIDEALSATCTMLIVKNPDTNTSDVHGRMGGKFYGSEKRLKEKLKEYFGDLVPKDDKHASFTQVPEDYSDDAAKKGSFTMKKEPAAQMASYAASQRALIDFINPTGTLQYTNNTVTSCKKLDLTVLPDIPPSSTCDQPHPHKVSSSFPKDDVTHKDLVRAIYTYLKKSCYYADVNMYMSFHCLGGKVTKNAGTNAFGYAHKPYMLQIQAWWDDVSNAFTNEGRNSTYVQWVKEFRETIAEHTEGSFINFVDKTLVPDIKEDKNRLELLEIYYTKENLNKLQEIKKQYDPENLFRFEMSILPK